MPTVEVELEEAAADAQKKQMPLVSPSIQDYTAGAMMRAVGGIGAQTNAPKRKMDALAGIRGHCGLLNNPERLKRLKEQSDLALSLASIRRAQQEEKKSKKEADVAGLFNKAPEALLKLDKKGMDAPKFTKEEICSVAHCCFQQRSTAA